MTDQLEPAHPRRSVLLTGDLRFAGAAIASAVAVVGGGARVLTLGSTTRSAARDHGVAVVGDCSKFRLGVPLPVYRNLVGQVDAVVHVASAARSAQSESDEIRRGRQLLDFVHAANAPLYWVGAVAANRDIESPLRTTALPVTVLRSPLLIGDSRTGAIPAFPGIYRVLEAILQWGHRAVWPLDPATRVDFLPIDLLAAAVAAAMDNQVVGQDFGLTQGDSSLTLADVLNVVLRHRAEFRRPADESIDTYGRHSYPHAGGSSGSAQRRIVRSLVDYHGRTSAGSAGSDTQGLADLGVAVPDPREALLVSLRYWSGQFSAGAESVAA